MRHDDVVETSEGSRRRHLFRQHRGIATTVPNTVQVDVGGLKLRIAAFGIVEMHQRPVGFGRAQGGPYLERSE